MIQLPSSAYSRGAHYRLSVLQCSVEYDQRVDLYFTTFRLQSAWRQQYTQRTVLGIAHLDSWVVLIIWKACGEIEI